MTFVMDNPVLNALPVWGPTKWIAAIGWTTCYYVAMFIIPLQYWYRYSTVTKFKMFRFRSAVLFTLFLIIIHVAALVASMKAPNENLDNILLSNQLYEGDIPKQYISMDTVKTILIIV